MRPQLAASCILGSLFLAAACGSEGEADPPGSVTPDAGGTGSVDSGGADASTDDGATTVPPADGGIAVGQQTLWARIHHSCLLRPAGKVACWGSNNEGALGDGTEVNPLTFVEVKGLTGAVEVALGSDYGCARRTTGRVVCWGSNNYGQLGDGDDAKLKSLTFVEVSGLTDAVEVAPGDYHACARKAAGTVVCWGYNVRGALGDGTKDNSHLPVAAQNITDAVEIAGGAAQTCARTSTGSVMCWGGNTAGQLGDGTKEDRPAPVIVSGLTDAVEIGLGSSHACARRATGAVVCWGDNSVKQLGNGTVDPESLTPVAVSGLTDAVELSVGFIHSCARRATGTVVCWGANSRGQLGDGTKDTPVSPVAVNSLTDAVEIAVGQQHSCARRASGAVVCWGNNEIGQIGDGTKSERLAPTPVTGLP